MQNLETNLHEEIYVLEWTFWPELVTCAYNLSIWEANTGKDFRPSLSDTTEHSLQAVLYRKTVSKVSKQSLGRSLSGQGLMLHSHQALKSDS